MASKARREFCGRTRREFLWESGCGFGAAALASLLSADGFFSRRADAATQFANPLALKPPVFPAKAKSVIFLFMYGGPSHIDTFDYKPAMVGMDGKTVEVKTFGRQFRTMSRLRGSRRILGVVVVERVKARTFLNNERK